MDTVRMGIIGVGNMGSSHAKNIYDNQVPGMVLAAIADINPERLQWARETFPGVALFDNASDMMDSGLIDEPHCRLLCTARLRPRATVFSPRPPTTPST